MINTRLVLVSSSVYTFKVSKTTFPRQGQCIDAYACKERLSSEETLVHYWPDWRTHSVTTRLKSQPYV
jgi:hypothetical protein